MKRTSRKCAKSILTILLCTMLCISNVMSAGMTVLADEQIPRDGTEELPDESTEEIEPAKMRDNSPEEMETEKTGDNLVEGTDSEKIEDLEQEEGSSEQEETDENVNIENPVLDAGETDQENIAEEENGDNLFIEDDKDRDGAAERAISAESILVTSEDDIASGSYKDIRWVLDKDGKLTVEGTGDVESQICGWYEYREQIKSAKVNVTGTKRADNMFWDCLNMTNADLSGFDTSEVESMFEMFGGCSSLTDLDVSHFNTSNVTNMDYMFSGCKSLIDLDVSHFDTQNVTRMFQMFCGCGSLTDLDVSHFDTANVTKMSSMFHGCSSLTDLDVSHFDTANVTNMWGMFCGCSSLTDLDVSGFNTQKVEDMSYMFSDCSNLTNLDVSGFNTQKVEDMCQMFADCNNLKSLDVSSFDTQNVIDMDSMFLSCSSLINLDVSHFDTQNVLNMCQMFADCNNLKSLDISHFDTRNVTNMRLMFSGCEGLVFIDVNNFNTQNVTRMDGMFNDCSNLKTLDVSHFDTGNVTDMSYMFSLCSSLTNLDVSHFKTQNVTNMEMMFQCSNLTDLNLTSFDTGQVKDVTRMFWKCSRLPKLDLSSFEFGKLEPDKVQEVFGGCSSLSEIYTPRNVQRQIDLPMSESTDQWYGPDGNPIQYLPQNLNYSVIITKNKKTDISMPHISAVKTKTIYECGELLNVDDLSVTYYDNKGAVIKLTEGYSTNASDLDMSTVGEKTLVVSYTDPTTGAVLTTEVILTVTFLLKEDNIAIDLADMSFIYDGYAKKPVPTVNVLMPDGEKHSLIVETDYTVSYENNVNAGEAVVVITGAGAYSGSIRKAFTIARAEVMIRVKDINLALGDVVPEMFAYEVTGRTKADEDKAISLSFAFKDMADNFIARENVDTSRTGKYYVIPQNADVGTNYTIDVDTGYIAGTLTITEERIVYSVIFDLAGHGSQIENITGIKAGSLIKAPVQPEADGYLFTGWYQDRLCTKRWDFNADTVQSDITLYACWVKQTGEGGVRLQEIAVQEYTGKAVKPTVYVYAADGTTLLKSGKDYSIKYYNNIDADQVEASGGIVESMNGEDGTEVIKGFHSALPYVVITGKGNHKGTVYSNFHIAKTSISDKKGNEAAGFTLKYTDQLARNGKAAQKPFCSLKYKKALKAGRDYDVTLRALEAFDAEGKSIQADAVIDSGNSMNAYMPLIPKGFMGTFNMIVEGKGNYTGSVTKMICISDKERLIQNVSITLGKAQKSCPYDMGEAVTLAAGYYDTRSKKYYKVESDGSISDTPEVNAYNIYTVKAGKEYLIYGKDYIVSYANNRAVGTAVMTVHGIGNYMGTKRINFKITGKTFNARNVTVTGIPDNRNIYYTGKAQTWNKDVKLTLKEKDSSGQETMTELHYGIDYMISYRNNIRKGTATMIITAKPDSGYSGSIKKTFKIDAADLESITVKPTLSDDGIAKGKDGDYHLNGKVTYTREGAKPSSRVLLVNDEGDSLKEGVDYTVSYANIGAVTTSDITKFPTMTFQGKGNYKGKLRVTFTISKAELEENEMITVSAAEVAFDGNKTEDYTYHPKVTVRDGRKVLKEKKDYILEYVNCTQQEIKAYLEAMDEQKAWSQIQGIRPYVIIRATEESDYTSSTIGITADLSVYETKLKSNNLYVVVLENSSQSIYSGHQVTPEVTVYYGDVRAVSAAKENRITDEDELTALDGIYKLTKLAQKTSAEPTGHYTLSYGKNITAGKNKGSITVTGAGIYGGKVTVKFTIQQRDVYSAL